MQNSLDTDFHLSHSIINYLNAQYRAHFAYLNALHQLGSSEVNKDLIQKTQKSLAVIVKWNQDLIGGMPIFSSSWKYPESFDAQKAFDILNEIKEEIKRINDNIRAINESNQPLTNPDDIKYVLAVNMRYVYGRENYIKGYIEYAKYKNNQVLLAEHTQNLPAATEEIKAVTAVFKEMKEKGQLSSDNLNALRKIFPVLRGIFRAYINDINFYLSIYEPKYTFQRAEFSESEAKNWQSMNFDANTAACWRAYDFHPHEAAAWLNANFYDPSGAYFWKLYNFVPEEAASWISIGVPADIASQCRSDGQTPDSIYKILMKQAEKSAA